MERLEGSRTVFRAVLSLLLAAALFYAWAPLTADVSHFVPSAGRLPAGDRPSSDILETNPPQAFRFALPPVALAALTGAGARRGASPDAGGRGVRKR